MQAVKGVREKLVIPGKLAEAYIKAKESIKVSIKSCITDLQQLEVRHNEHIEKHMCSYGKFEQLRRKLINGEPLYTGEVTGDSVAKMLKEIEDTGNIENPYCLPGAEVEQHIAKLRQCMTSIKINIEAMWRPSPIIEFKDQIVTFFDLALIYPSFTSVSFIACKSKEWVEIGQRLAILSQLKMLSIEHYES
jgi:hypothetical protein